MATIYIKCIYTNKDDRGRIEEATSYVEYLEKKVLSRYGDKLYEDLEIFEIRDFCMEFNGRITVTDNSSLTLEALKEIHSGICIDLDAATACEDNFLDVRLKRTIITRQEFEAMWERVAIPFLRDNLDVGYDEE